MLEPGDLAFWSKIWPLAWQKITKKLLEAMEPTQEESIPVQSDVFDQNDLHGKDNNPI
jgi:hypothetical protein